VYGVDRADGSKEFADRPFGDKLCVRNFILHAGLEYSELFMSGGCSDEGKTFRAIVSSKPSTCVTIAMRT